MEGFALLVSIIVIISSGHIESALNINPELGLGLIVIVSDELLSQPLLLITCREIT